VFEMQGDELSAHGSYECSLLVNFRALRDSGGSRDEALSDALSHLA